MLELASVLGPKGSFDWEAAAQKPETELTCTHMQHDLAHVLLAKSCIVQLFCIASKQLSLFAILWDRPELHIASLSGARSVVDLVKTIAACLCFTEDIDSVTTIHCHSKFWFHGTKSNKQHLHQWQLRRTATWPSSQHAVSAAPFPADRVFKTSKTP